MAMNHVDIDSQQVSSGLGKWDPAAEKLADEWRNMSVEITNMATGAPWGDDAAGSKFRGKYEPGAEKFIDNGHEFVKSVQNTGQTVRGVIVKSLASDEEQEGQVGAIEVPRAFRPLSGSQGPFGAASAPIGPIFDFSEER